MDSSSSDDDEDLLLLLRGPVPAWSPPRAPIRSANFPAVVFDKQDFVKLARRRPGPPR